MSRPIRPAAPAPPVHPANQVGAATPENFGLIQLVPEWLARPGADGLARPEHWNLTYCRVPRHPTTECLDGRFLPLPPGSGRLSSVLPHPAPGYCFFYDYETTPGSLLTLRVGFSGRRPTPYGPTFHVSHSVVYGSPGHIADYAAVLGLRPWPLIVVPAALTPNAIAGFAESVRHMVHRPDSDRGMRNAKIHTVADCETWVDAQGELVSACRTLARQCPDLPAVTKTRGQSDYAREIREHLDNFVLTGGGGPARPQLIVTRGHAMALAKRDSESQRVGGRGTLHGAATGADRTPGEPLSTSVPGAVGPAGCVMDMSPAGGGSTAAPPASCQVVVPVVVPQDVLSALARGERELVERLAAAGDAGLPVTALAAELHAKTKDPVKSLYSNRGRADLKLKGFVIDAAPSGHLRLRRN